MLDRDDRDDTRIFEDARPKLVGLAYRILGSLADAEDAVQDTFIKWTKADRKDIRNAVSWLMTVCTRRCLDTLRAAQRTRVDYPGSWLPEPVQTPLGDEPGRRLDLASSLTTAFLLMLERLAPKERAAYLLREIFDVPYSEIADTLDIQESACRKLVSRAKVNIERARVRHTTPLERQRQLLTAFQAAINSGTTTRLASLLSSDVRLSADGGGKVPAILDVLRGEAEVGAFLSERLHEYWRDHQWQFLDINGACGVLVKKDGATTAAVSFAYDEADRIAHVYIVRNPDKLTRLDTVVFHGR